MSKLNIEDFAGFDAKAAKALSTQTGKSLFDVLVLIKAAAKNGDDNILLKEPLSKNTIYKLKERDFSVFNYPQLAIQKEGFYHKISW